MIPVRMTGDFPRERTTSTYKDPNCPLCRAEKLTVWHYADPDGLWWIADCLTCGMPLLVFGGHGRWKTGPISEDYQKIMGKFFEICEKRFGYNGYCIDGNSHQFPDHVYFHGRPRNEALGC